MNRVSHRLLRVCERVTCGSFDVYGELMRRGFEFDNMLSWSAWL